MNTFPTSVETLCRKTDILHSHNVSSQSYSNERFLIACKEVDKNRMTILKYILLQEEIHPSSLGMQQ